MPVTPPTQAEIHQLVDPYDYYRAMKDGKPLERVFHPRRVRLVQGALDWTGLRVLEVGSGTGCMAISLAKAGVDLLACELSLEHCQTSRRYAREEGIDLPVIQADGERLPLPDNSFDAVVLCDLVEHNPFPGPLLREAERVCKAEGTLIVGGPWQKHPKAHDGLKALLSGKKHGAADFPHNTPRLRRLLSRSELLSERYDWLIGWYVALFRPSKKGT